LTHASVGEGTRRVRDNERLEFLGDRVLGLLIRRAADRALSPWPKEGELSPRLQALVNRTACARVARRLGLGPALRLSPGENKTGGRDKDTILGDACEALLARCTWTQGLEASRRMFLTHWAEEFAALDEPRIQDPNPSFRSGRWRPSARCPSTGCWTGAARTTRRPLWSRFW
jgi:ribonuclease-3